MIFTGFPAWFVLLCIFLAAGYAVGLYFRERRSEIVVGWRIALGVFRFFSVFTIAFLLLSPFIKSVSRTREKPVVVIAQDNSGSILMNADSAFYQRPYLQQLDVLASSLEPDFNVKRILFGESVSSLDAGQSFSEVAGFDEKLTDMADLFSQLSARYTRRNLGAVVVSTDGIYNSGYNPVYMASQSTFPIYSIALGDTTQRRDLILSHVAYNRLVYLDNKFPLQITVYAHDCEGAVTTLRVEKEGQPVFSRQLQINSPDYTETVDVILQATETGLKRYRISLTPAGQELSAGNNATDIFIEVLDARNKILILYHSPHPDIAALRHAVESNMNYEVDEYPVDEFEGQLEAYNMVVLHQVPAREDPSTVLLQELRDKEVPVLFILGTLTDLSRINQWEEGLKIISPRNLYEEALPVFNPSFSLFTVSDETRRMLSSYPPLTVPSGNYQQSSMASALLYQRIGSVETSRPMILLGQNLLYRSGWITGEGIWRWRLMNYAHAGNHQAYNDLFNKIFQYLSLKEQKKNLRIYHRSSFPEYDKVLFDAEVYNMNYELINEPELEISITDEEGRQFPFTFSRTSDAYRLDAGKFQPGRYAYQARVNVGEEVFLASGQFTVSSVEQESLQLVADHKMLRTLSAQSMGVLYYPSELDELRATLMESSDIKPVIYSSKKITELISLPWLLIMILALLTVEWFIRKRSGSY